MADIIVAGNTSGAITISAPLVAGSGTLTLPVATDTLVGKATTDTLTNKSIAATQLTGTIAASVLPAGSVLQFKNFQTGTLATGTTLIPNDNTIPQITEGNEYMTLAITPTSATSRLAIGVIIQTASSVANLNIAALFQDAISNALATQYLYAVQPGQNVNQSFLYTMISGTTSSITFRVRAGCNNAGTTTFNGDNGAAKFGGTLVSSITITEYAV